MDNVAEREFSDEKTQDPYVGRMCGRYKLVQRIGEGGMGSVYLAVQPQIGKRVAVKILNHEFAQSPDVVQRFFLEARLVNEINNAHIVDVLDFCENDNGMAYLVMELLEGVPLTNLITSQGPGQGLDESVARQIGAQIAMALAAAHAIAVVHRDLKPDNVFVMSQAGAPYFVKLLDFGIAKLIDDKTMPQTPRNLTQANVIMGTPLYISPEQVFGQELGPTSDIYALGCILYEMSCGTPPFEADTIAKLLEAHVRRAPVPLRQRVPTISAEFEAITLKCLQKQPEDRFQRALDVALALQPDLESDPSYRQLALGKLVGVNTGMQPIRTSPSQPRGVPLPMRDTQTELKVPRKRGMLLGISVAVMLICGAAAWFIFDGNGVLSESSTHPTPSAAATGASDLAGTEPSKAQQGDGQAGAKPVADVTDQGANATTMKRDATPRVDTAVQEKASRGNSSSSSGGGRGRLSHAVKPAKTSTTATKSATEKTTPLPPAPAATTPPPPKPAAPPRRDDTPLRPLSDEKRQALDSLARLCDQGTLTPAECRAKRNEIVHRK